jgi:hypothetical protein
MDRRASGFSGLKQGMPLRRASMSFALDFHSRQRLRSSSTMTSMFPGNRLRRPNDAFLMLNDIMRAATCSPTPFRKIDLVSIRRIDLTPILRTGARAEAIFLGVFWLGDVIQHMLNDIRFLKIPRQAQACSTGFRGELLRNFLKFMMSFSIALALTSCFEIFLAVLN